MKSQSFETYKELMKPHWEEEVIQPSTLLRKSLDFFKDQYEEYAINYLFLNLFDFQVYLADQINKNEFKDFFKDFHKKSDKGNFPFMFPFPDEKFIRKKCGNSNLQYDTAVIREEISQIRKSKELQKNLLNFLEKNPILEYYFWNVTFPNMFGGFLSHEFCEDAKNFLLQFEAENERFFFKGSSSFIRHNYYFQISFMKSFFVNYEANKNEQIINIQTSLKKSIQKLTIPQLDILEILINKKKKEINKAFFNDFIIDSIKLWKYSPLFSSTNVLFEDDGKCKLIDDLKTLINNDDDLQIFLEPIFKVIKAKITSNEVYLGHLITSEIFFYPITLLDILIITKVVDNKSYTRFFPKYMNEFNDGKISRFLITKAFYYAYLRISYSIKFPKKEESIVDMKLDKLWENHKTYCINHNKNPLEFIYNGKKISEADLPLANYGLIKSYDEWNYLNKVKEFLKKETKALIPFKAIIEAQTDFITIISNYYTTYFPHSTGNYVKDMKFLTIDIFSNIFMRLIIHFFKNRITKYNNEIQKCHIELSKTTKQKVKDQLNNQIEDYVKKTKEYFNDLIKQFTGFINSDLSEKFTNIFNVDDAQIDNVINMFNFYQNKFLKNYADSINCQNQLSVDKYMVLGFKQIGKFLQYIYNSQLIFAYNNKQRIPLQLSTEPIKMIDFEAIESLKLYEPSGIFSYIRNSVLSLQNQLKYADDNKNFIGQIFSAVPVINQLLSQFVKGQNTPQFIETLKAGNEVQLAKMIFEYSFLSYFSKEDAQKAMKFLYIVLFVAFKEISKLHNDLPFLDDLYNQFLFLQSYLNFNSNQ